jgi:hypothetical protein
MTAEHAETLLGLSVVSGTINESGHLILTRANGTEIDAGDFTAIVTGILEASVATAVGVSVPNAVAGTVINRGSVSGALTIPTFTVDNMVNAMVKVTATGNITFDVAALPSSPRTNTQWVLRLQQDATGGRTFTTTGFKKSLGTLPITTAANAVDLIVFIFDGTDWLVGLMGVDFK